MSRTKPRTLAVAKGSSSFRGFDDLQADVYVHIALLLPPLSIIALSDTCTAAKNALPETLYRQGCAQLGMGRCKAQETVEWRVLLRGVRNHWGMCDVANCKQEKFWSGDQGSNTIYDQADMAKLRSEHQAYNQSLAEWKKDQKNGTISRTIGSPVKDLVYLPQLHPYLNNLKSRQILDIIDGHYVPDHSSCPTPGRCPWACTGGVNTIPTKIDQHPSLNHSFATKPPVDRLIIRLLPMIPFKTALAVTNEFGVTLGDVRAALHAWLSTTTKTCELDDKSKLYVKFITATRFASITRSRKRKLGSGVAEENEGTGLTLLDLIKFSACESTETKRDLPLVVRGGFWWSQLDYLEDDSGGKVVLYLGQARF